MSAQKQDAKADLLPCPFCGAEKAAHKADLTGVWLEQNDHDQPAYWVACWSCCAHSDERQTPAEAIAAWNRRASPKGCGVELREAVARIVDPWAFKQCEWASSSGNDDVLREWLPKRGEAYDKAETITALINQARQPEGAGDWVAKVSGHAEKSDDPISAMLREASERLDRTPPDVFGAKVNLHVARLAVSSRTLTTDNADGLSDDRAVAWRYQSELPGRDRSKVWRVCQSADEVENLRDAGIALQPLFTRPPAGKDLAGDLKVALTEAADAIRFFDKVKAATQDEKIAVGQDHWNRLEAALRALAALGEGERCKVPPPGWFCTRKPGHEGPCAAWPDHMKSEITSNGR